MLIQADSDGGCLYFHTLRLDITLKSKSSRCGGCIELLALIFSRLTLSHHLSIYFSIPLKIPEWYHFSMFCSNELELLSVGSAII